MDNDLINQSPDHGFLYVWGIERFDELISEGVNVGEFGEGLGMEADLSFGSLVFHGTWQFGILSLRSGLGPAGAIASIDTSLFFYI